MSQFSTNCSYCPYFSAWYMREICTSRGFMSVSRSHCCRELGFSSMCSNAVKHTDTQPTQLHMHKCYNHNTNTAQYALLLIWQMKGAQNSFWQRIKY